MKTCNKCLQIKELSEFSNRPTSKDGRENICRACVNITKRIWEKNNEEKYKLSRKLNREKNIEYVKQRDKNNYLKNRNERLLYKKTNYLKNKDKYLELKKQWYQKNKKVKHSYEKNRKNSDLNYKLRCQFASRIVTAIKKNCGDKSLKTIELLGCSIEHCIKHIESQFKDGMSWENHGLYGWHIDHIKPCSSFDLSIPEEQKKCFHYTNLQPLWAKDNLSKGAKII